jgi:hypothetical protein
VPEVKSAEDPRLQALAKILDGQKGRYELLRTVASFEAYLAAKGDRADEEILTEPVLALLMERVLDFPTDEYVPQLGKSGLKPDFTPRDLIAHSFVLDAKSSEQDLGAHERQIRGYISQRLLDYGVLFNLRELRVYRRTEKGFDTALSFPLLPLWKLARGEALPGPEYDAFTKFCERFRYREIDVAGKIKHVRELPPWSIRLHSGESVEVDVEFLVDQLRVLSREMTDDAAAQTSELDKWLALNLGRAEKLLDELRLLANDLSPGVKLEELPAKVGDWRTTAGLPKSVAAVSTPSRVPRADANPPVPRVGRR